MILSFPDNYSRVGNHLWVVCDDAHTVTGSSTSSTTEYVELTITEGDVSLDIFGTHKTATLRAIPYNGQARFDIAPVVRHWLSLTESVLTYNLQGGNFLTNKMLPTSINLNSDQRNGLWVTLRVTGDIQKQPIYLTNGYLLPYQSQPTTEHCIASKRREFVKWKGMPLTVSLREFTLLASIFLNGTEYASQANRLRRGSIKNVEIEDWGVLTKMGMANIKNAANATEQAIIRYEKDLPDTPVYMRWMNAEGGWEYQMMAGASTVTHELKNRVVHQSDYETMENYPEPEVISSSFSKRMEVCAPQLLKEEYAALCDVLTSPYVHIYEGGRWIPAQVTEMTMRDYSRAPRQDVELELLMFSV